MSNTEREGITAQIDRCRQLLISEKDHAAIEAIHRLMALYEGKLARLDRTV